MSDPVVDYLSVEFFRELTEERLNGVPFEIKSVQVKNITGHGEGYLGTIYGGLVEVSHGGTDETHDYIIKVSAGDQNLGASVAIGFFPYKKEIEVYEKLPVFQSYFRDTDIKLAPISFKATTEPFELIVLENLKVQGWQLGQQTGFNLEQSLLCLKHLARFHAASAKFVEAEGPFSDFIQSVGMYSEFITSAPWGKYVNNQFNSFKSVLGTMPEFEREVEKLNNLGDDILKHLVRASKVDPEGFNVLNHGDLWNSNIFFKYSSDGKPSDVIFIDFQIAVYGSFAQDFLFFLTAVVEGQLRAPNFDLFVETYHQELQSQLVRMEYEGKIPTLKQIHLEILQKSAMAVACFAETYSAVEMHVQGQVVDIAAVSGDDEESRKYRETFFRNPRFLETARLYLPFLRERGMLDPLSH